MQRNSIPKARACYIYSIFPDIYSIIDSNLFWIMKETNVFVQVLKAASNLMQENIMPDICNRYGRELLSA